MSEQLVLNFDRLGIESETELDLVPEPEIEKPMGKPGEFWNGSIYVSDDDLGL